jgi:hypothetical protein
VSVEGGLIYAFVAPAFIIIVVSTDLFETLSCKIDCYKV